MDRPVDRPLNRLVSTDGSRRSLCSRDSFLSIGSVGSFLSIGSVGSFLSIGSVGSALSIGSVGSALSIGSVGSAASVLSVGSWAGLGPLLSAESRWSVLPWRSRCGALAAGALLATAAVALARRD
ncbi:hypothetical protein [Streptomyces griseus]|uniref:hypothetical protein n=1 Tax=Streptomyces griseus TaxID=1911 RepID=UPI00099B77CF|nr:hypothetical protein [Streptomyces griseus]